MKESCWVLFPFVGFQIEKSINNFESPLFNDATIVNTDDALKAAEIANWPKENIKALETRLKDAMYKRYHSFIGVKRTINPEIKEEYKVYKNALIRAEEVATAIGLSYLYYSEHISTKRLLEHNNCRQQSILIVQNESNKLIHLESGFDYIAPKPTSQEKFNKIVLQPAHKEINELLLGINLENTSAVKAFQNTLKKAARLICKVINIEGNTNPSATILGCFTALEILLGDKGNYSDLKNRLTILNNPEGDDYFEIDNIFNCRNDYVHRSKESVPKYARLCIGLALNTLYKVSQLSHQFITKLDVINYLDLVHTGISFENDHQLKDYMIKQSMQFKTKYRYKFIEQMKEKADNTAL